VVITPLLTPSKSHATAQIPDIANPELGWTRLKEASEQVVEQWNDYRKGLPRFFADALIDAADIKPPEWSAGFLAGASAHHVFGLGLGIVVGVLTYSGTKVLRTYRAHRSSPYRYLTRIYREGATLKTPTPTLTKPIQHTLPL
jgi:hypothetical protein